VPIRNIANETLHEASQRARARVRRVDAGAAGVEAADFERSGSIAARLARPTMSAVAARAV
jgi:hypothetical protein